MKNRNEQGEVESEELAFFNLDEAERKGWDQEIEDGEAFVVVADSEEYFEDAVCFLKKEYARELGKPFRVFLYEDVRIPDGFFAGVKDIKIKRWSTQEDIQVLLMGMVAELTGAAEKEKPLLTIIKPVVKKPKPTVKKPKPVVK